ncbi:MAG TPA: hypothetical protein VF407_00700 [Polyangiaceae bacterium]
MILAGCKHGEPPTYVPDASETSTFDSLAALVPDAGSASADAGASATASTDVDAGDPGLLPQTNDRPSADTAQFMARMQALWAAIVSDDVDKAMPAFFPETAYEQTKAIAHPESDWKRRLVRNFKRDIHALHVEVASTGVGTSARLVRIDLPDKRAGWVQPGDEGNKLGYFRVYGTKIVWSAEGQEHESPITSLISWRGEWYVVHLTGFK